MKNADIKGQILLNEMRKTVIQVMRIAYGPLLLLFS